MRATAVPVRVCAERGERVMYCCVCVCAECQRAHWPSHKAACKAARKAAKKDTTEKKE